jgi:hypothetical protein
VSRRELFGIPAGDFSLDGLLATNYHIGADGQRFLVARAVHDPDAPTPELIVVQNWLQEMKEAVGR